MLILTVVKGPDEGVRRTFEADTVTIGAHAANDMRLSDQTVSRFHGRCVAVGDASFDFHDLRSRNGSVILEGARKIRLHDRNEAQRARCTNSSIIKVGHTHIRIELAENPSRNQRPRSRPAQEQAPNLILDDVDSTRPRVSSSWPLKPAGPSNHDRVVRAVTITPETAARNLAGPDKIRTLFRVTNELNALTSLEEIMDRVADAAFQIFPLASFFAVCVPEERGGDRRFAPVYARLRNGGRDQQPIISQSLLRRVAENRESILFVRDVGYSGDPSRSITSAQITAACAAPLLGQRTLMGVIQVDSRGHSGLFTEDDLELLTALASSTALAMERAKLSRNIVEMFEAFVTASVAAIEARDPTTAGHSQRVADYCLLTAHGINGVKQGGLQSLRFSPSQLNELRYAALVHDFGKIGVREEILQKASRLMPGCLDVIHHRLDVVTELAHRRAMEQRWEILMREGRAPTAEDLAWIDKTAGGTRKQVQEYRRLIIDLQQPRPIDEEEIAIIRKMASTSYQNADGEALPLITADEARDLTIRRGTLNAEELAHIRSHAHLGREYLSKIPWSDDLKLIPCIAGDHHETIDGAGYPRGISGDQVIPQVRILSVCDIYDALTAADRPYKKAQPDSVANRILRDEASRGRLDSDMVEFFTSEMVPRIRETRDRNG